MASIKTAPPSRPLPPPPSPLVLPVHSQPTIRASMPVSNTRDASRLGVPTNPRVSGRASPQPSQALSVPPLGPPPSLPLPDLPPFPSPVIHQGSNTRVRTIDATPLRPSLPKRVSEHIISEFSPASPTRSIRSNAESVVHAHVARRVASSASLGKRSARPLSTASVWSVASVNSHLSAANEALGQSMAELDRDADAMGILLSSSSSRADGSSRSSHSSHSRSLGSSSGKRRGSSQRPSLPSSNSAPVILSLNGEPPSTQPPLKQSNPTLLLTGSLRKVSLRSLYPPPDSAGLPSPNEEEEREPSHNNCNVPTSTTRPHPPEHSHISIARGSVLLPTRLSSTRSSVSSGSGNGSISGGSVSYCSAASSSSATTGQVRGRSRLGRKAGRVAAAEARAAEEGRESPDVVDMLEATPRPARKKSSGSLAGSVVTSRPPQSKERPRSKSRPRNSNGSGNDAAGLKLLRGSASNGCMNTTSSIMSTLSDPVPLPPAHPPSSFIRSRHQLSEITRRATEDTAAMTVVSPTESTGDDVWMTADCGEGVGSGSESESSIDLHTPLPHILVRDGMLSPTSTVVRSLSSSDTADLERRKSKGSRTGCSDKTSQTEVRKRRHRDGRLLREGVGLTTGLGWSDSEDEDSPGPMRRRLSRLLLRHVDGTASDLAGANAEYFEDNSQSPPPRLLQPPPSVGERKQSLRKVSSSICVLGAPEPGSDPPRSVLSANPSLDAKVKALLARAEAYKKETQARMVPAMTPYAPSGLARRLSLTSNSTSIAPTSGAAPSRPASLPRSSILSLNAPIVSEVGDDSELAAAEAAYRHSKEISASLRCALGAAPRSGKLTRTSSSVGSRDSIYSTASSGATEFGILAPSTKASHRTRSRTVSASNSTGSGPPPSAFYFPPAIAPKQAVSIGTSTGALSSTISSIPTSSPSASTAPSSARQSLMADFRPPDDSDPASRIAKLSNASTTSVSSAAQSLTPSLFSVCSLNSADSSCTSDGGGIILPISPACRNETVNVIPPSPMEVDEHPKVRAPSLRAPRKQLSRRSSLAPLAIAIGGPEDAPDEARSNSHKPRKPSTLSTPSPRSFPDSSEIMAHHSTRRVPTIPKSIPLSRLRASTAPSTAMT